jgi:DNA-binding NarL/FixJ family response regulator
MAIRVLLVDDHSLVREGLKLLISGMKGIKVIAETGDGLESIKLVKRHKPDVVMLDISMPGISGLDVIEELKKKRSKSRILILSMFKNPEQIFRAFNSGALGYILKNVETTELEKAIRTVSRNNIYLSPLISREVLAVNLRLEKNQAKEFGIDLSLFRNLTLREREVLKLIADGYTNKEIAKELEISINTVETHRLDVMKKLDIHNVAGLVRYSIETGLLTSDQ